MRLRHATPFGNATLELIAFQRMFVREIFRKAVAVFSVVSPEGLALLVHLVLLSWPLGTVRHGCRLPRPPGAGRS